VILRESMAYKNKEPVPGQTLYDDFEFTVCFLVEGDLSQITMKIRSLKGQLAI